MCKLAVSLWEPWEITGRGDFTEQDAYLEDWAVVLTGPDGTVHSIPVFSDGPGVLKARHLFAHTGTWQWSFANANGRVEVKAGQEKRPPPGYFLRVSDDRRHLVNFDGQPFFWLGDTAWNLAWFTTLEEWSRYCDNRAGKKFTVIQVHATNSKGIPDLVTPWGLRPFQDGLPMASYWQELERKIDYANYRGLVVLLVGVGRSSSKEYVEECTTRAFARYVAARLRDRQIIFSPNMDIGYESVNDEMGRWLKQYAPHILVTQHVETSLESAQAYHPCDYLDFTCVQSGHGGGDLDKAYRRVREWPLALYGALPVKPMVNAEAMYDALGNDEGPNHRSREARQLGWLSMLSGSFGYTYGVGGESRTPGATGGIWKARRLPDAFDYWEKAIDWPSAFQMTHLRTFFEMLPWWQLVPRHDRLRNEPEAAEKRAAIAQTPDGLVVITYLPAFHRTLTLDLADLADTYLALWYNPRNGHFHPALEWMRGGSEIKLDPPLYQEDWALLLRRVPVSTQP